MLQNKTGATLILLILLTTVSISAAYTVHTQSRVTIPILLYHDIQNTGVGDSIIAQDVFLSHLDAIQQAGYETVTFQQLLDFVEHGSYLPEKPILITFDDGYLSNYEIAWPALQARGMVGTIFVIGCLVGTDTYKDTQVPTLPHFTYQQAREMMDSGVISIQSHTYDLHQYRPLEPDGGREGVLPKKGEPAEVYRQALKADFQLSRDTLRQNTEAAIQVLAYPYGLHTTDSEFISAQLGFSITLTTQAEPVVLRRNDPSSLRLMGRYSVDDCTPQELLELIQIKKIPAAMQRGFYTPYGAARSRSLGGLQPQLLVVTKSAASASAYQQKLRPLPCSSSPNRTHYAGLRLGDNLP